MPSANLPPDWWKYYNDFLSAKTKEEKIRTLEIVLSHTPKHKACHNLLAQLKSKLAKLKKQKEAKAARKAVSIAKEGDAQVCLIGPTQSGKSTLLKILTNANPKISNIPYTTKKPEIGTLDYYGVKIQLVEIPSSFKREYISIVQNCDALTLVLKNRSEKNEIEKILKEFRINKAFCEVSAEEEKEKIKEKIWKSLGLIRVYTKEPGKNPEKKPLVLRKGSTVRDAAKEIHKDFLKFFKFTRVWGKSAKYEGQSFGLNHELEDGDIIEFHLKK